MEPKYDWTDHAACRGEDIERFYSTDDADIEAALAICDGCPVRAPCLAHAMDNREAFGVWGGVTEAARRRIFRRERRQRAAARRDQAA